MRGAFALVWLFAVAATGQLVGGGGSGAGGVAENPAQRQITDITFYFNELLEGTGPCHCPQPINASWIPMCIASLAQRCEREQAADVDWILANGGFATLPESNLTRAQISAIFANTTFGPCNVFQQLGYNVTLHSAWTRTYVCRGVSYAGVEAVETVFDPITNLVTWNWIANEPLWAGLGNCVSSILASVV